MPSLGLLVRRMMFPLGSTATIRRGPLRGCSYVVTEQSGWAPIAGRWEPEAQQMYVRLVKLGETVWDLGANTGIHSLLFSKLVGPSGHVLAFEPLAENIRQIERTCELNDVANISIVPKAVSDTNESTTFYLGAHDKQGSLRNVVGQPITVECTTIDAMLQKESRVDFIKMDIEGAESQALRGFTRPDPVYPTFSIDLHSPDDDINVGQWLKRHGYAAFRLVDSTARRSGAKGLVEAVRDLDKGWPARNGVWGTIIAVHPSRNSLLEVLSSLAGEC